MTIEIITLVLVFINCLVTIFSFVGYACSKKRKAKLEKLEIERLAKIDELKNEIEQCDRLIENDTTPNAVVFKTLNLKNNLEQQLELLNKKK